MHNTESWFLGCGEWTLSHLQDQQQTQQKGKIGENSSRRRKIPKCKRQLELRKTVFKKKLNNDGQAIKKPN